MTITDTYLVRPQERELFEENCKKCDVKIVSCESFDMQFDKYTFEFNRAHDLIQLGVLMALDQLNQKK